MHQHKCRHCRGDFVCSESVTECYRDEITCDDCFWEKDFPQFLFVIFLAVVAVFMTIVLFSELKPAFN